MPLLVLRRMDAVLAPTKQEVLDAAAGMQDIGRVNLPPQEEGRPPVLHNTSPLTFASLLGDDKNLADNLRTYIRKLSPRRMP